MEGMLTRADLSDQIFLEEILHTVPGYVYARVLERLMSTASTVMLPDGTETAAENVICEGCSESMASHSCSGGTAAAPAPTIVVSRSTGPRKVKASRPRCPHCGGAVHFSMPGGLQNVECLMRQFYLDTSIIPDPDARLPLYGVDEIASMVEWSKTLSSPLQYGRMESAAGGSGTYASLHPKGTPRAKKQKEAASGERIEDIAAGVEPKKRRGSKAKAQADRAERDEPATKPVIEPSVAEYVEPTSAPISAGPNGAPSAAPAAPAGETPEELRARRRAVLAGTRA